jgi:hypothetical protein
MSEPIDVEALAYKLWQLDSNQMPHDSRNLVGLDDVIAWTCPQCGLDIYEWDKEQLSPCTVDWRWPLHKKRFINMVNVILGEVSA